MTTLRKERKNFVSSRIDAMKMTQNTLQQLMTLSAGGLVLFFSFIVQASFIESLHIVGILVVLSWITSLCMAAIAHKLLGDMVILVNNLFSEIDKINTMEGSIDEAIEESTKSVNPEAVLKNAKNNANDAIKNLKKTHEAFEKLYFPKQMQTSFLVDSSLAMMIIGFIILGTGYAIWAINLSSTT